jgi:1-aminocyclopropane-1-carboxylate deaminase
MLSYQSTPVTSLQMEEFERRNIQVLIKREDLNHPFVSGNKWWKLKYNLEAAASSGNNTLLTFGGAFSNHIHATAAAAHEVGFKSIGIIRGEKATPLSPTLEFAARHGMHLHFVSREEYKRKTEADFVRHLQNKFGKFYLIPEGGSNHAGIRGCFEFAETHLNALSFDYLISAVGTGATMAGLISAFKGSKNVIGVPVLKDAGFLKTDIEKFVYEFSGTVYGNWTLLTSYHHGGYAKTTGELIKFIVMMQAQHNLLLDPVYTGKLVWAVVRESELGTFPKGSTVLVLHTGGLQGAENIMSRYGADQFR